VIFREHGIETLKKVKESEERADSLMEKAKSEAESIREEAERRVVFAQEESVKKAEAERESIIREAEHKAAEYDLKAVKDAKSRASKLRSLDKEEVLGIFADEIAKKFDLDV
jgi:vacuolar-type H+-ATPase subunit H